MDPRFVVDDNVKAVKRYTGFWSHMLQNNHIPALPVTKENEELPGILLKAVMKSNKQKPAWWIRINEFPHDEDEDEEEAQEQGQEQHSEDDNEGTDDEVVVPLDKKDEESNDDEDSSEDITEDSRKRVKMVIPPLPVSPSQLPA